MTTDRRPTTDVGRFQKAILGKGSSDPLTRIETSAPARCPLVTEPIAVDTSGVINSSVCHILDDLGRMLSLNSDEAMRDTPL